ncbi:uncharacterized protein N7525_008888 [Penicillium rubens]|uniref:uncharacterized protein n=1 Tax=Penicillium rubens TaxID=1108849 RepID=UPI002A5A1319|nr:uncharacterized protein N7525_008888 [Penicillium rubens]KAJ5830635.1 hypothetical protein N7525_008888 [Penicillium rubens]KAJ5854215.1 hypothetical protein N7534_006758 [Penicillium rubens]
MDSRGISGWLRKMVTVTKASSILFVAGFMMKPALLAQFQCVDSMATGIRLPRLLVRAVHNHSTTITITLAGISASSVTTITSCPAPAGGLRHRSRENAVSYLRRVGPTEFGELLRITGFYATICTR